MELKIPLVVEIDEEKMQMAIDRYMENNPDVVYVVRCKDCKYRHSSEFCECREEDAFCSDGERREE